MITILPWSALVNAERLLPTMVSAMIRRGGRGGAQDDDESDDQPSGTWASFRALVAPQAQSDFLAIPDDEPYKSPIFRILEGDNPNEILQRYDVTIEAMPPVDSWSVLRIGPYWIFYRRLTLREREGGDEEILVGRIRTFWPPVR